MKTNQIMIRDDSRFIQRTSDGYFNATNLLHNWNKVNKTNKLMSVYNKLKSTIEFINQLKEEGIETPIIINRGVNGGTWMHPKLFIDFAMWINIKFKSKVIDMVLDGLINSRNDAGDYFNEMCATIMKTYIYHYGTKPNPILYINEARMIKEILEIDKPRNEMTEKELSNITSMQKLNSLLISDNIGKESRIKQLKQHKRFLNL